MDSGPPGHFKKRISPMLAVANMEETLAFYQQVLKFTPGRRPR